MLLNRNANNNKRGNWLVFPVLICILVIILFGAKATLIYFPQEISTSLLSNIRFYLFISTFFSKRKKLI